ncbi:hypothetical protein [Pedobacter nyackensis]|uniref:Uncharacterized protein n=1 Tax=Pedobacter nyackensis TaxID=475255 RepID=A0A1W2E1W5_9SPHI|nr:hypothetical protein [Pedobacter nyackensis]SMD03402.1 hypothetical protein SAMN04488101_10973 [Pedobacter nyackensis]
MDRSFVFKALLFFILALPKWTSASVLAVDTAGYNLQDEKKDKSKEKSDPKQEPVKPDISTVPKARKQSRPPVVKPNIKAKPIKVIRPNIKRP